MGDKKNWAMYWRDVCAPKLLAKKKELGRGVPEREIAAAVEAATGKQSERGLVWMWLHGEREPYISQFFALCEKLKVDPEEVLTDTMEAVSERTPLRRTGQGEKEERASRKPDKRLRHLK